MRNCPVITLGNIQEVQPALLATARGDGLAHNWPTNEQVSSYLKTTYNLRTRRSVFRTLQQNTATSAYGAQSLSGNFGVIVDFNGVR